MGLRLLLVSAIDIPSLRHPLSKYLALGGLTGGYTASIVEVD